MAKEYLLARIAPRHPAVATLPQAFRTPLNPHSLWGELARLTGWFNHLTSAGVTTLDQVEQRHCETYLASILRSSDRDRLRSPAFTAALVRAVMVLGLYAEVLSDGYRVGFTPWAGRSADDVAGYQRTNTNRVPPVPDALLRPLLEGCLYLLDTIGPHLVDEAVAARAADQREAESRRGLGVGELGGLREAIEHRCRAGTPAYRADQTTISRRLNQGWDRGDPLLGMAWHPLVVETAAAMGHRRNLEALRPELQRWVAECGLAEPWGRDAALVARHRDGEGVPWTAPMSRRQLDTAIYAVTSAAFYLTSALSGMRASELAELSEGCRRQEPRPSGGGSRFRLLTRRIKGEAFGGVEDAWVVIEDVHRAIGLTETLTGVASGQRLFAHASNNSNSRCTALRAWINGEPGRRLGLEPIPAGPINPRALRRTLAITLAARPHGLMAAKYQLKHLSVATTEGYTARPGGHQATFAAEVAAEEHAEAQRLTLAAYHDYQQGVLPSGQGARELVAAFQAVDQTLAGQEPGPVTVVDDRRVERLLQATAKTLHVGIGNYCWFSDPGKALCLKLAGTPDAQVPLIGMCDSARCSQATHHRQHRQVWSEHAEHTRTVFLGNPRLSKPERARAQAAVDRATRVIAEIDAASQPEPALEEIVRDA